MACTSCAAAREWPPIEYGGALEQGPSKLCYTTSASVEQLASLAATLDSHLTWAERCASTAVATQLPEGTHLRRALERVEAVWQCCEGTPPSCPAGEGCSFCRRAKASLSSLLASSLPVRLLERFLTLGFEAQKDVMWFFDAVLRFSAQLGMEPQVIECMHDAPLIPHLLVEGCGKPESALHFGHMFRVCARHPGIAALFIEKNAELRLVEFVQHENLGVACDAFESLRALLMDTDAATSFLETRFDGLVDHLHSLLAMNYFIQRQTLWLLGNLLLKRGNTPFMMRYINDHKFLEMHMKLLLDTSQKIQEGAFHVFKIFVANPYKPRQVDKILSKNRGKLLHYLSGFRLRVEDTSLIEDLQTVTDVLEASAPPPVARRWGDCC